MPYKRVIRKGDDFLEWLFSQGTRVVEFMNTILLIGFTIPLLYNFESVLNNPPYTAVYLVGNPVWWGGMSVLGFVQWYAMSRKGIHSNQVSGFILIVSGWTWCMIASLFLAKTPPLTPTPIVYMTIGFVCVVAGIFMMRVNKKVEDRYFKG